MIMVLGKQTFPEATYMLNIAGHQLYYRSLGPQNGNRGESALPLVLLHGYGVSGHMWQRTLPYFAQRRQVFVVDLPGHGRSHLHGAWSLRKMAPLLAAWARKLELARLALIGHSMGGAIAIHLAASAPELVERLVLVDAAGLPLEAHLPTLIARSVRSQLQRGGGGYPSALVRDVLGRLRPHILWQAAQEMVSSDFRAELATISIPTLIIWGERDVLLPFTLGQALSVALPHATFVLLPNCGHRPPLSQPETFSQLVLDFLQSQERYSQ